MIDNTEHLFYNEGALWDRLYPMPSLYKGEIGEKTDAEATVAEAEQSAAVAEEVNEASAEKEEEQEFERNIGADSTIGM